MQKGKTMVVENQFFSLSVEQLHAKLLFEIF